MRNREYFTGFLCAGALAACLSGGLALLLYLSADGAPWPRLLLLLLPFLSLWFLNGSSVVHFVYKTVVFLLLYVVFLAAFALAGGGSLYWQYYRELVQTADVFSLLQEAARLLFSRSYFLRPLYAAAVQTDVYGLARVLGDLLLFSLSSAVAAVCTLVRGFGTEKRAAARYRRRLQKKK